MLTMIKLKKKKNKTTKKKKNIKTKKTKTKTKNLAEAQERNSSATDGLAPVKSKNVQTQLLNDHCFDLDFSVSKPYSVIPMPTSYNTQCLSLSVHACVHSKSYIFFLR